MVAALSDGLLASGSALRESEPCKLAPLNKRGAFFPAPLTPCLGDAHSTEGHTPAWGRSQPEQLGQSKLLSCRNVPPVTAGALAFLGP